MRSMIVGTLFLGVPFGTFATTTSTDTTQTQSMAQVNDSDLTSNIQSRLASDPLTASSTVQVNTNQGVVILTGIANTDAEGSKVIEIAQATPGVREVDTTQLQVKDSKQPFSDTVITAKVKGTYIKEKLFGDKDISLIEIGVETKDGVVYLSGTADSQEQADNAVRLAKNISGVKNVNTSVRVTGAAGASVMNPTPSTTTTIITTPATTNTNPSTSTTTP